MSRTIGFAGALALSLLALGSRPAHADFSACAAAYEAKDLHQKIDLYTSCLKHGGISSTDIAGAFNNRGFAARPCTMRSSPAASGSGRSSR